MSKKALLNEATVRRFMKLANFKEDVTTDFVDDLGEGKDLTKLGGNKESGATQHSDHKLKKAKGGGLASKGHVMEEEVYARDDELDVAGDMGAEAAPEELEPEVEPEVEPEGDEDVLRRVVRAVAAELDVDVEIEGEDEGDVEGELPPVEDVEGVEAAPEGEELPAALEEKDDAVYRKLEEADIELEEGIPDSIVNEVARRVASRLLGK